MTTPPPLPVAELERMVRATIERLVQAEENLAGATHRLGLLETEQLAHTAQIGELEGREAPVDLEHRLVRLEGQLQLAMTRQKGDKGDKGDRGFPGQDGQPGPPGNDAATVIREVKISG